MNMGEAPVRQQRGKGGRPKENPAWRFCEETTTEHSGQISLQCTVPGCTTVMKGDNISNFERHLMRAHPNEYTDVMWTKDKEKKRKKADEESGAAKKRKISPINGVKLTLDNLRDCCLSMVCVSGRPFAAIDDPGFQFIIQRLLEAMPPSERKAISSFTIRELSRSKGRDITKKLHDELSNRLVCLKVDSASRGIRNFLGINVQYIQEGKIILRTLALKEMLFRATAVNIKATIEEVLHEHGVPLQNVYSYTSDNGSNMILAGTMLMKAATEITDLTEDEGSVNWNDEEGEMDHENQAERDLHEENDEEDEEDVPLQRLRESLQAERAADPVLACSLPTEAETESDQVTSCIRCAAHCLQLAVSDATKAQGFNCVIERMRQLSRKLRTKNGALLLKDMNLKCPRLDNDTRWHSSVDMLSSLLPLKEFCGRFAETAQLPKISQATWDKTQQITDALKPAKIATKRLQEEQLVMGDMYGAWITCKLQTKALKTRFADQIVREMEAREALLLEEVTFAAALYMDPRYFSVLNAAARGRAESHLVKLWRRIEKLHRNPSAAAPQDTPALPLEVDVMDELESVLGANDAERIAVSGGDGQFNILPKLKWYIGQPRLRPASANVLQYWESRRFQQPELYALATVALSVPATQVSVERLFSGMAFILADNRFNLTSDVMNDLLKIRQYARWTKNPIFEASYDAAAIEVDLDTTDGDTPAERSRGTSQSSSQRSFPSESRSEGDEDAEQVTVTSLTSPHQSHASGLRWHSRPPTPTSRLQSASPSFPSPNSRGQAGSPSS